jgi:hypothetical protein
MSDLPGTVDRDEGGAAMEADFRWCAECAATTLFEQPPCEDGHGLDCLDLACSECGMALVLGDLTHVKPMKDVRAA